MSKTPKTAKGSPCKLCTSKGSPGGRCHLHGGSPKKKSPPRYPPGSPMDISPPSPIRSPGGWNFETLPPKEFIWNSTPKVQSPPKKKSPGRKKSPKQVSSKKKSPKSSSSKIYYDTLPLPALQQILLNMDRPELRYAAGVNRRDEFATNIILEKCIIKNIQGN